jgi:hypothetical protein
MPDNAQKFANVPQDELDEYVKDSEQKPGETDTQWKERVSLAELALLAKHKDRPATVPTLAPSTVKDDPEAEQEPTESNPQ